MIKDYYQVFYGKVAEKTATLNKEQAKNSAEGLAYRIPSLLSARDKDGNETVIALADFQHSVFVLRHIMYRKQERTCPNQKAQL